MDLFILASNAFIFIFWYQMWGSNDKESFFNPYLMVVNRWGIKCLSFIQPIAPKASLQLVATIALLFVLVLRAFIALNISTNWNIIVGLQGPQVMLARTAPHADLLSYTAFSFLSFAFFLVKLWALQLLVRLLNLQSRENRATMALHQLSQPVAALPYVRQFFFIFLSAMLFITLLNRSGELMTPDAKVPYTVSTFIISWSSPIMGSAQLLATAIAFVADVITLYSMLILMLIILGFIANITQNQQQQQSSRDLLQTFLGPINRLNAVIGPIDLRPIIMMIISSIAAAVVFTIALNLRDLVS